MILVEKNYGGMCNTLFSFANQMLFARASGRRLLSLPMQKYIGFFSKNVPRALSKCHCAPAWQVTARWVRHVHPQHHIMLGEQGLLDLDDSTDLRVQQLSSNGIWNLAGFYTLTNKRFISESDWLRDVFQPKASIQKVVFDTVTQARE